MSWLKGMYSQHMSTANVNMSVLQQIWVIFKLLQQQFATEQSGDVFGIAITQKHRLAVDLS